MRARTFAYLAPLALAWGCSQATLRTGDAAADTQASETDPADVPIDAGAPTDAPAVIDAPRLDTAPADAVADTTDATLDTAADSTADTAPTNTDGPPPLTGRHAYVVTSTLTLQSDGGVLPGSPPSSSHVFTMVVDADRGTAIAGAYGSATSLPVEVTGNGFRLRGALTISTGGCFGSVTYADPTFQVGAGGQVTGSSTGRVFWTITDIAYSSAASMSLTGVNDTQPPVLSVAGTAPDLTDPLISFSLVASEPLPPDTRAKLISSAGGEVVFAPPSAEAFSVSLYPQTLLRYDQQYHLSVDGITDLAGNAAGTSTIQFTTRAAPPLTAEDGFESTTAATLGGAQIVTGADAPVITGARSLYIPASTGGLPIPMPRRTQFALRLPVAPGDSVVRFAYRTVNPITVDDSHFVVAVPGGQMTAMSVRSSATPTTNATIAGQAVTLRPLATAEIPLPAGASSEVVLARTLRENGCTGLPSSPVEGLLIDDLRVE